MADDPVAPAPSRISSRLSLAWAVAACACVLAWQFLTVHYNYQGNWTALFNTGAVLRVPAQFVPGTYRFPGMGYDGQFYRYIAHDPFFVSGSQDYIDAATMRYRRILVPGLAFFLAGGRQQWIDGAYLLVTTLFILLGSYWLSRWAVLHGFHPAWALAFPLIPATLVSIDRMTIDGALAAIAIGAVYSAETKQTAKLYLLLMMACLVRDTGWFLLGGWVLFELQARRFARSALWATAGLPALAWYAFVYQHLHAMRFASGIPRFLSPRLRFGMITAILSPRHYPFPVWIEALTRSLDALAVVAIMCAMIAALVLIRARPLNPISIAAVLYAALALVVAYNQVFWSDCHGYGRTFSPLLLLVALQAVEMREQIKRWWWMLLPLPMLDLRICLQLGAQAVGIFRGMHGT